MYGGDEKGRLKALEALNNTLKRQLRDRGEYEHEIGPEGSTMCAWGVLS